jgi:hypothetical protein
MFFYVRVWLLTLKFCNFLISGIQTSEKQNQEHFVLTFPKTPMPDKKKRSGPSELEVAVPVSIEESFL